MKSEGDTNVIVMTATIQPMVIGKSAALRADPAIRRADYEQALKFYLSRPRGLIDRILFLENSASDLGSLKHIADTENPRGIPVEFFQAVSDCPPEYGKGHAELLLLDRAYHAHVADTDPNTRFWKVTGRLTIPQIEDLIDSAPSNAAIYIDMRLVPSFLRALGTDKWADTRLVAFTPEGYQKYFLDLREQVGTPGNQHVLELVLFPRLLTAYQEGDPIEPRFRVQPVFQGIGATSLKNYDALPERVKSNIRAISRRIAPRLWL